VDVAHLFDDHRASCSARLAHRAQVPYKRFRVWPVAGDRHLSEQCLGGPLICGLLAYAKQWWVRSTLISGYATEVIRGDADCERTGMP
jgi:hypothetical protein